MKKVLFFLLLTSSALAGPYPGGGGVRIGDNIPGGHSGSILYLNNLGHLTEDNGSLFYEPSSQRTNTVNANVVNFLDIGGNVSAGGALGIGLAGGNPGQMIHTFGGNWFMDASGEVGLIMRRTALTNNPIFNFGRIITAGDGSPELRVMYSDDLTPERAVFEFDKKGIISSVKPAGLLGSFYEGFVAGDTAPFFRLNGTTSGMRLEMGSGGTTETDTFLTRTAAGQFTLTGDLIISSRSYVYAPDSGNASVSNATVSVSSFQATTDVLGEWTNGSQVFTAKNPGYYSVTACVSFTANVAGFREMIIASTAGIGDSLGVTNGVAANLNTVCSATTLKLLAGQTISPRVYQNSGGALGTNAGAGEGRVPALTIVKL